MKNVIECKNCGTENPFFNFTCNNCKSYLRDRVYNIDLWKVISLLIESPTKAYQTIIHSEHKNFIFFISILAAAKFFIDAVFFSLIKFKEPVLLNNVIINYLIIFAFLLLFTYVFSYIINFINGGFGLITRVKDNFAILIYSLIPYVFALIILFTVELVVFGSSLFSANPSPFILKEALAYALTAFEVLVILWSLFLSIMAIFTQSKNIFYSIITGLVFQILIFLFLYFFPFGAI